MLLVIEIAVLALALQREEAILKFNCLADAADTEQEPTRGKKVGRVGREENKRVRAGKQMNCTLIRGKNSQTLCTDTEMLAMWNPVTKFQLTSVKSIFHSTSTVLHTTVCQHNSSMYLFPFCL